jgi:hypothetical protein
MDMVTRYAPESWPRNAQFHAISGPPIEGFVETPQLRPAHYASIAALGDCDIDTRLTLGDQTRFSARWTCEICVPIGPGKAHNKDGKREENLAKRALRRLG